MTADESIRASELARRFAESRQRGDAATQIVNDEAKARTLIVAEMLTFMSHGDAAGVLGVHRSRIGQMAAKADAAAAS